LSDLRESAARLADASAAMPADAWAAVVRTHRGPKVAAALPWLRWREVEVHHVDLDAGYAPADWPQACSQRLLREVVTDLGARPDPPALVLCPTETGREFAVGQPGTPTISGPACTLAAWLTGRSRGDGLTVIPDGALPTLPKWI
jgi:maleylpyruvate isomerase